MLIIRQHIQICTYSIISFIVITECVYARTYVDSGYAKYASLMLIIISTQETYVYKYIAKNWNDEMMRMSLGLEATLSWVK